MIPNWEIYFVFTKEWGRSSVLFNIKNGLLLDFNTGDQMSEEEEIRVFHIHISPPGLF